MIEDALKDVVSRIPGISSQVQVYQSTSPADQTDSDRIVFAAHSGHRITSHDSGGDTYALHNVLFQFDCCSLDPARARQISGYLLDGLNGFRDMNRVVDSSEDLQVHEAWEVQGVIHKALQTELRPVTDASARFRYRASELFSVWYRRRQPSGV